MVDMDVYLSAGYNASWAIYFGQDNRKNIAQKCMQVSECSCAELEALCHLYRRWLINATAPKGLVTVYTRCMRLMTWIQIWLPTVQRYGWASVADDIPSDIEPLLRYLNAASAKMKSHYPGTEVDMILVPKTVEHVNLDRAKQHASQATGEPMDIDWDRLALRARRHVRWNMRHSQPQAMAQELEGAEKLVREAMEQVRKNRKHALSGQQYARGIRVPLSSVDPVSVSELSSDMARLDLESPHSQNTKEAAPRAFKSLRTCIPITSIEAAGKYIDPHWQPDLHLYLDLCGQLIPDFPNVRVTWHATKAQKSPIKVLAPVIRRGSATPLRIEDCRGITYHGLEQVSTQLFKQAQGGIKNPITLVVCYRYPAERLSCIGNLPFLVAAASTELAPVKLMCLKGTSWKKMFTAASSVAHRDRCFALTAAECTEHNTLKAHIDSLDRLTVTDLSGIPLGVGRSSNKRSRADEMHGGRRKRFREGEL
ncbi:hypothetical protein CYLTODRAFT_427588 [Cylindrobasidium torrendii FP15055 ss-10]|uniref:Uncharacterized protein n=1 Tax=Cylindrobasidium torrendii FP15055 ss-10 TaxID=1314674 RepID=A0A0D7AVM9_9AGAR|nr:hypothetical protein CYLTODRAFT_427588 [Cylindrobasidium torrendii FP15055 ss-10]